MSGHPSSGPQARRWRPSNRSRRASWRGSIRSCRDCSARRAAASHRRQAPPGQRVGGGTWGIDGQCGLMRRMPTRPVLRSSLFLLGAALLLGAATAAAESEETVVIRDGVEPASLEVAAGTTVTWRNEDDERHRIRSREGPVEFDSGDLEPGEAFSYAFMLEGSYPYLDERDDEASDYFGTVVVGPSPGGSTEAVRASASAAPLPARPAPTIRRPRTRGSTSLTGPSCPPTSRYRSATASSGRTCDDEGHTVSATEGAFESGLMAGGVTFSQVFDTPGTFDYACAIHPEMRGTVTVAEPGDAASPVPPSGDVPAAGTGRPGLDRRHGLFAGDGGGHALARPCTGRTTTASSTPSQLATARSTRASCRPGTVQPDVRCAGHLRLLLRHPPAPGWPGRRDRSWRLSQARRHSRSLGI